MKPLQSMAMGCVFFVLVTRFGGYDAYADPAGWLLVLNGLRGLPDEIPHRSALWYLAGSATVISVPLWFPRVVEILAEGDPALAWAVNLPQFGFLGLLCHALAQTATTHRDLRPSRWLRTAAAGFVLVIVLPVLVFGGGLTVLEVVAGTSVVIVPILLIVLLFSYAGRPWARAPSTEHPAGPTDPT